MQTIYLTLTVDLDPDNFDASIFGKVDKMSWKGIDEGLPPFLEKIENLKDSFGSKPLITWFVRADKELFDVYGDYNYLLGRYSDFLNRRLKAGDEIGWHPHENKMKDLISAHEALKPIDKNFVSVRVGNSFHNNDFMHAFSKWGFKVDSTALPGRIRSDKERILDWRETPEKPYFPSASDYRLSGGDSSEILEVPFSMIETQSSEDQKPIKRYLNLSYEHNLIQNSLRSLIAEKQLLVSIVHPSELLDKQPKHSIIAFGTDIATKNLAFILKEAETYDKKIKFTTMKETGELVNQKIISYAK
ncbi:MAG: hypothetical protein V1896_01065 [Candidatus Zambryskibacteria bacterium]